jgi:hypothetical protein
MIVECAHVIAEPPWIDSALLVEVSVTAVLAGAIVVADAVLVPAQAATRAIAPARPSLLRSFMRENFLVSGKPICSE